MAIRSEMSDNEVMSTRYTISVEVEFAVIRSDPEYAEMGNPNGDIIGDVFYLCAETADGARWVYGHYETAEAAMEGYLFTAPPVSEWLDSFPRYGSEAYQSGGARSEYWDEDEIEAGRQGKCWGAMLMLMGC